LFKGDKVSHRRRRRRRRRRRIKTTQFPIQLRF
jgi:hypothetical protein